MKPNAAACRPAVALAALLVLGGWACAGAAGAPSGEVMDAAARLVEASGRRGGMAAVVGASTAELPLALAKHGRFTVQALVPDADRCDTVRDAVRAAGVYGTVSADVLAGDRLPYADNLLTILVLESWPAAKGDAWLGEARRVLAPLGTACIRTATPEGQGRVATEGLAGACREAGFEAVATVDAGPAGTYVCARKPWPDAIDEWTHYLHGPDGNPVARDTVVGPPRRYQWTSDPVWMQSHETDSSVSTLVTARGRLFAIVNRAPTSLAGPKSPPDAWHLVARDAFNGRRLWDVPIRRWGWREWKPSWFTTRPGDVPLNLQKRLVARGDAVYVTLGYHAPVSRLDARTGEILHTYDGTERTNEILFVADPLSPRGRGQGEGGGTGTRRRAAMSPRQAQGHASVAIPPAGSPSPRPFPVKGEGDGGTLVLSVLRGEGVRVTAVDAATGKRRWITEKIYRGTTVDYIRWRAMRGATEPADLDPAPNIATDGRTTVALIDGPNVVGLDYATGEERWTTAFPSDPADEGAGGIKTGGNLWNGTMIVAGGVVLHASPHVLAAIDARTGEVRWTRPKAYIGHLWYEWKDVFVIDGLAWTWGEDSTTEPLARGQGRRGRSRFPQHVCGYDLATGEVRRKVALGPVFKTHHHHRCYRNKATPRYILASRRGDRVRQPGGRAAHDSQLGARHVPRGDDAGERAPVRPAAPLRVLYR
jgi:outer membrane protein assembly factor BamB